MKYFFTPLNILALVLFFYAVYMAFSDQPVGDGLQRFWVLPAVGLALLFLLTDFIIQKFVSKYNSIFLIELSIPCLLLLIPKIIWGFNKANTLNFTTASGKPYCAIIYDVKNADDVFVKGYRDVPENGVLFSADKLDGKLREIWLTGDHIVGHSYFDDQLNCSGKIYNYRAWYLVVDTNKSYNGDSLKIEIKRFLPSQCEAIATLESE